MSQPLPSTPTDKSGFDPFVFGTFASILSVFAYTAANVCLRWLTSYDPMLVSCAKAVPTMLAAVAMILASQMQGKLQLPSRRALAALVVVASISHPLGNVAYQWALARIGLALSVPLCLGTMIVGATILARVWLGEGVTMRSALALVLLIASIVVLSFGAEHAAASTAAVVDSSQVTTAIVAVLLSGLAFAMQNVLIRRLVIRSMQMPVILAAISSIGVIELGLGSFARLGWQGVADVPLEAIGMMFLAGTFNAVGFFSLTKALQLVSVVYFNAVSASQSALAALAGLMLFGEKLSVSLVAGIALTILGLSILDRAKHVEEA